MPAVFVEVRQAGREEAWAGPVGRIKAYRLHLKQERGKVYHLPEEPRPRRVLLWGKTMSVGQCWPGLECHGPEHSLPGEGLWAGEAISGHESFLGWGGRFDGPQLKKPPLSQALVESRVAGEGVFEKSWGPSNGESSALLLTCVLSPAHQA